jgi:GTP-binding protein
MSIQTATFIKGILGTDDILYDGKFQVAFLGRSNVGKSTLINSLTMKKSLAKSSSSPGQTTRMEFYLINNSIYFVDFPGYGYARRTPEKRDKLAKMILWYLLYSEVKHRLVLLILDAKVGMTKYDKEILGYLREGHIDHLIIANKFDNVTMSQKEKQLAIIQKDVGDSRIVTYSSKEKNGKYQLLEKILSLINSNSL